MKTPYNEGKAIAAATYLLQLSNGQCDKYWLNKVLYYIERQSLIETGQPMFFDDLYAIKFGPILSKIKDSIDETVDDDPFYNWSPYITLTDERTVSLVKNGEYDLLSDYEINLIKKTYKIFKDKNFEQVKNFIHSLPEHKEVKKGSIPISYEEILSKSKMFSDAQVQEIIKEINYYIALKDLVISA